MPSTPRRLGYTKEEVTAHGFRATASTILNSRGFDADDIEAVRARPDRNAIRRLQSCVNAGEKMHRRVGVKMQK